MTPLVVLNVERFRCGLPPSGHRRRRRSQIVNADLSTGVALITFILLAVKDPTSRSSFWSIFVMRVGMIVHQRHLLLDQRRVGQAKFAKASRFNFEIPLTTLVLAHLAGVDRHDLPSVRHPDPHAGRRRHALVETLHDHFLRTIAGALIPELVKVFTSTNSGHVREVLSASREGGASLNILSGIVAGYFGAYSMGIGHHCAHGHRVRGEHGWRRRPHGSPRHLRFRPGGLRLPGHGPGRRSPSIPTAR